RRAAMAVLGLPWEATVALTSAKRHKLSSVPGIGPGVVRLLRQWLSQPLAATDGDGQQPAMLSGD
ncbi:MAG: helix-hairpin-helix domain-containing protein, partial [Gemmataceae bacterium]|nr:helix-hairpin-helix domain-containing protein [Gemmataceae bacterium]